MAVALGREAMFDEKAYVINAFQENFGNCKDEKIVIYGLGKNTKIILDEYTEFSFVGLMDGVKTGEKVWNLPVITCEQAKEMNVSKIIIIATAANVPLIYRRIANKCRELQIDVYAINGEKLEINTKKYALPEYYSAITQENLRRKIDSCDVVSFDIFDTLLVRSTLVPSDVFCNIAKQHADMIPEDFDFVKERIAKEHELYHTMNPKLHQIYEKMAAECKIEPDIMYRLMELELQEEMRVLSPREAILEMMQYARYKGKEICCISDMYIPKEEMLKILSKKGIFPDELFISCEYGVSKSNGLFEIARSYYKDKRILHIGDNEAADIDMAFRYGINETFQIASVYKMAEDSKLEGLLFEAQTLGERNVLGNFLSVFLNNPFLFSETGGKIRINSGYEMGYFILEPVIRVFVNWMLRQIGDGYNKILLLAARDGWLIKQLLDIAKDNNRVKAEYKYFYASRMACTLAGMKSDKDVRYAASMAFDGSMKELLKKRFLLTDSEILERKQQESDGDYLARHIPVILDHAKEYRNNYKKYILLLDSDVNDIAFFDFVSSGTCQLWLENIFEKEITGYYFIRNYEAYKNHLHIYSMYEPKYVYEKQSRLFQNYIVLEKILTSPEPSLRYIDSEGNPVFGKEERDKSQIEELLRIHQGILDAYKVSVCNNSEDLGCDFAGALIDMLKDGYSEKEITFLNNNKLIDEFCNRDFDISSILADK